MRRTFAATTATASAVIALLASGAPALAQAPAPAAPAPASPPTSPLTTPAMAGPLVYNPNPLKFDAGPAGDIYVSGVASALGLWQDNPAGGNIHTYADIDNGQVFVQKIDGWFQWFAQAGAYSIPDIGAPYIKAGTALNDFWGPLPQAYAKLVPNDMFSFEIGKLPTLQGAEYTFSFENMNIERGLLWNQENAVNRGIQGNFTKGPIAASLAWTDGFYSNHYTWILGSVAYTLDPANVFSFVGSGNTKKISVNTIATPVAQNNEELYNLIYTHTAGPWTFTPYLQWTYVPTGIAGANAATGGTSTQSSSTSGIALLVNYSFDPETDIQGVKLAGVSLPFRLEYISSRGSGSPGAPNLLYGTGSKAWSLTVTPTYQYKVFFGRAELSYVKASNTTNGFAFGPNGDNTTQVRGLLEAGVLF